MTNYVNPYTGQTVNPTQVGYEALTLSSDVYLEWPINGNDSDVVASIIDVNPTANGYRVFMPPATQVSEGQSVIFRNTGSHSFSVVDGNGGAIATIASGIANFIYLTNNTTYAGTWAVVTFGAGTSSADAASLAGYGLLAINTTLNQAYEVTTVYSNYTFLPSDRASFYVWESGVGTLTLPSASSVGNNWFVMIRNNGSGILTLSPQGTDTIDGNPSQQLQVTESLVICSNGTGFNTFAYGRSNSFYYTQLQLSVTGGTTTLSTAQATNTIQEYIGTLTSDQIIILPSTVQLYSLQNNTTGSYTLTFKTAGTGTTLTLPQNQTIIAICDGTNVYSAQTASITGTSLTLGVGSASNPSLNFLGNLTTGMYLVASGQIGWAIGGANAMTLTAAGLLVPNGVLGGSF